MLYTIKTIQGQSFLDKTLELTGSIESLIAIAIINNRSVTDDLSIGDEVRGDKIIKPAIVAGLRANKPATKIAVEIVKMIPENIGIGEMIIENSLIIH